MSVLQWGVIALNIVAFLAMVTAFVVGAGREEAELTPRGDDDFPPLDYTQYRSNP